MKLPAMPKFRPIQLRALTPDAVQARIAAIAQSVRGISGIRLPNITREKVSTLIRLTVKFRVANLQRRIWRFITTTGGLATIISAALFVINFDPQEVTQEVAIHGIAFAGAIGFSLISGSRWRHWRTVRQTVKDELKEEFQGVGDVIFECLETTGSPLPDVVV